MHTYLVFFLAAFGAALPDDAPTFDPAEEEIVLLDEYDDAYVIPEVRALQVANYTNTTDTKLPLVPLAAVGVGGAAVAAYFLLRPAYTYETVDYDHAAESGLLDHEDYEVHYDDGSDEYYE